MAMTTRTQEKQQVYISKTTFLQSHATPFLYISLL